MRQLHIKRNKTFVGCAGKTRLYIEDEGGDLEIKGVICRKLGELKNGEDANFEIPCSALSLFAIADKASRNYCVDCYKLPEGEEDISLSGKCRLNTASANAFVFDGNDGDEAKSERKAGMKRGLMVMLIAIVIGAVIGFCATSLIIGINNKRARDFEAADFTITLTEGFRRQKVSGTTVTYASRDMAVYFNKMPFNLGNMALSESEYAKDVAEYNNITCEIVTDGTLTYFVAPNTTSRGTKMLHYTYVYKTDDAFWLVQFAVKEGHAARYEDDIASYADSIIFK
jgi:hypothetical protein